MSGQQALFTGLEKKPSQVAPRGFRYQEEAISEQEQTDLVTAIQSLDLKPFEFHGYIGNRRVINFGFKYDFTRRFVEKADGIPQFLHELLGRAAEFAGNNQDAFQQVGINEYQVGAGIGWHKDKPEFWDYRRCVAPRVCDNAISEEGERQLGSRIPNAEAAIDLSLIWRSQD